MNGEWRTLTHARVIERLILDGYTDAEVLDFFGTRPVLILETVYHDNPADRRRLAVIVSEIRFRLGKPEPMPTPPSAATMPTGREWVGIVRAYRAVEAQALDHQPTAGEVADKLHKSTDTLARKLRPLGILDYREIHALMALQAEHDGRP